MFLSRLFHKKNKKKWEEDVAKYEQARYATLETENSERTLHLTEPENAASYVVDLCEQMIDVSKNIEGIRQEYQMVTSYLTDIQIIEELTEAERTPIEACAQHVSQLEKQRSEFLKIEHKLSDTQYGQMQQEEAKLPGVIRRLKENENYLDKIKKDLAYLEGEKLQWSMLRTESLHTQNNMRKASCVLLSIFTIAFVLALVGSWYFHVEAQLPITIGCFVAAIIGVFVFIRYQEATKNIRKADINKNHAISLENHVKIRFVNMKNAVDYTCEKYHVHNANELQALYEQYQSEAKEKEQFRKTNDELEYYSKSLIHYLSKQKMYDAKVWIQHADAIIDSRELVELKHNLIERRQHLRGRIESALQSIEIMKKDAMKQAQYMDDNGLQLQKIIQKIDQMNQY